MLHIDLMTRCYANTGRVRSRNLALQFFPFRKKHFQLFNKRLFSSRNSKISRLKFEYLAPVQELDSFHSLSAGRTHLLSTAQQRVSHTYTVHEPHTAPTQPGHLRVGNVLLPPQRDAKLQTHRYIKLGHCFG